MTPIEPPRPRNIVFPPVTPNCPWSGVYMGSYANIILWGSGGLAGGSNSHKSEKPLYMELITNPHMNPRPHNIVFPPVTPDCLSSGVHIASYANIILWGSGVLRGFKFA